MKRLAVLRPEPGARATVERARAMGLDAFAMPLFKVEAVAWDVPDPNEFDALLLTSANAVRHGGAGLRRVLDSPVHAVGEATADALMAKLIPRVEKLKVGVRSIKINPGIAAIRPNRPAIFIGREFGP